MIPLSLVKEKDEVTVKRITGTEEVKHHLERLGLVDGTAVTVVSFLGGNMILKVKDSKLAISKESARCVMV